MFSFCRVTKYVDIFFFDYSVGISKSRKHIFMYLINPTTIKNGTDTRLFINYF